MTDVKYTRKASKCPHTSSTDKEVSKFEASDNADSCITLDRSTITSQTINEISAVGFDVVAYDADILEEELLEQISTELEQKSRLRTDQSSNTTCHCDETLPSCSYKSPNKRFISPDQSKWSAYIQSPDRSPVANDRWSNASEEMDVENFPASSSNRHTEGSEDLEPDDEECIQTGTRQATTASQKWLKKSTTERRDLQDDADDDYFFRRTRRCKPECDLKELDGHDSKNIAEEYRIVGSVLHVPYECWNGLYKHQKVALKWLSELHEQAVGGIMADEMGLGKTVQIIVFLRSLSVSRVENPVFSFDGLGPVLIVCPTTVMHQWLVEFRHWFPLCRVALMHSSGSFRGDYIKLINKISTIRKDGTVLITSYGMFLKKHVELIKANWHYMILDEGHHIRNPNSLIAKYVKTVRTPHRLIISGSPLQNCLREIWSLFDFVYPGRLGALDIFTEKFSVPITQGGYANANNVQMRVAYKCACTLRDVISPYILRRTKKDVKESVRLPSKNEQILFCDLAQYQRYVYKQYLSSHECRRILVGKGDPFVGLITLRKICNHPDLITGKLVDDSLDNISADIRDDFGAVERSGKMQVLKHLLKLWYDQKHKVLLFSQSRQMLTILEHFIIRAGYEYLRLDGTTAINSRQSLIDKFNSDGKIFVFLLTTRVGGLGVNLTGANRVVIFDPDWNPSTDVQARERAWRIGQNRSVTIYRLLTSGTIEEKIYHRQIFKLYLAHRVLNNPKQGRFIKANRICDLFSLTDVKKGEHGYTETSELFCEPGDEINRIVFHRRGQHKVRKEMQENDSDDDLSAREIVNKYLSRRRLKQLRQIARRINQKNFNNSGAHGESQSLPEGENLSIAKTSSDDNLKNIPFLRKRKRCSVREEEESKYENDYVLHKLLKRSGVHSVLEHDRIADGILEERLVEDEANSVAKEASNFLQATKSRCIVQKPLLFFSKQCSRGRGFFQTKMGRTSDQPLLNLPEPSYMPSKPLNNCKVDINVDYCHPRAYENREGSSRFDTIALNVRSFLHSKGGHAVTDEVLARFKEEIQVKDSVVFRSILKALCTFSSSTRVWTIRDEYR